VLAMSDASGFQDDTPFDLVAELLAPAAALEVLRLNRCLGLQLGIEGEGWRGACVRVCMCPGGGGGGTGKAATRHGVSSEGAPHAAATLVWRGMAAQPALHQDAASSLAPLIRT
jgi:hypothetical protein